MGKLKAMNARAEKQLGSPVAWAGEAFRNFQDGPDIPRPNMAESFIPVVGPAWEAVADLQDGNYGAAAFNGAMAVADALPVGVAFKGLKAASKGIGVLKEGSVSAGAAQRMMRKRLGIVGRDTEIHHTVPLNGKSRTAQDWRNHFAFLKPLPTVAHRRLSGRAGDLARFDPVRRVWYGTSDWMKAVPVGVAGYTADAVQNLVDPISSDGILGPIGTPKR